MFRAAVRRACGLLWQELGFVIVGALAGALRHPEGGFVVLVSRSERPNTSAKRMEPIGVNRPVQLDKNLAGVDTPAVSVQCSAMSALVEIEKAAQALSSQQKRELISFLGAQLRGEGLRRIPHNLPPGERAAELRRWAGAHELGPGLPDSAVGRHAIYD